MSPLNQNSSMCKKKKKKIGETEKAGLEVRFSNASVGSRPTPAADCSLFRQWHLNQAAPLLTNGHPSAKNTITKARTFLLCVHVLNRISLMPLKWP